MLAAEVRDVLTADVRDVLTADVSDVLTADVRLLPAPPDGVSSSSSIGSSNGTKWLICYPSESQACSFS